MTQRVCFRSKAGWVVALALAFISGILTSTAVAQDRGTRSGIVLYSGTVVVIPETVTTSQEGGGGSNPLSDPLSIATDLVGVVAELEQEIVRLSGDAISTVAPGNEDEFRKVLGDLYRIAHIYDMENIDQHVNSLEKFIETGELKFLNPLVGLAAAEVERARNLHWSQASPIPNDVISKMPPNLEKAARNARYIQVSKANETSLPAFGIQHLDHAAAMVMIDLIFFNSVPTSTSTQDLHLWAHELQHVNQYSSLGLQEFTARYLGEEIGFQRSGDLGNSLELEADRVACFHFYVPKPAYLPTC